MQSTLKYWSRVTDTTGKGEEAGLTVYEARGDCGVMVLFSGEDNPTPLAALQFRAQDTVKQRQESATRGKSVIWERGTSGMEFQGIISQPDQEFELVMTNFSPCHINFNILKSGSTEKVGKDNMDGGGLNYINELSSMQSYAVQCDQATKKSLILSLLDTAKPVHATVKDDDEKRAKKQATEGLYYYLSVAPDSTSKETCEKFKGARWKAMRFVVLAQYGRPMRARGFYRESRGSPESGSFGPVPRPGVLYMDDDDGETEGSLFKKDGGGFPEGMMCAMSKGISVSEPKSRGLSLQSVRRKKGEISDERKSQIVAESSLARVVDTGRAIEEHGVDTETIYNYDVQVAGVMLGLSIAKDTSQLNFTPISKTCKQQYAQELIEVALTKKFAAFLAQTYTSEQCTLCLERLTIKPAMALYECGHTCLHRECEQTKLSNCPLYRAPIYCRVNV